MNGCEIMRCRHYNKDKGLCECRNDTCVYNDTETDADYDTLKAKAELINELHDKVKTCCQVYSDAPLKFALEVANITKDILSKAKELK